MEIGSLHGLLTEMAHTPEAPAVYDSTEQLTNAELIARAEQLTATLAVAGVDAGHPVAVMLPDGIDLVAALFGIWGAGAVYVPLNPRLSATEVDRVLDSVRPAAVVTTVTDACRFNRHAVIIRADGTWRVASTVSPPNASQPLDADIALIQFTSGTTGAPKPVLLRHSGVLRLLDGVIG